MLHTVLQTVEATIQRYRMFSPGDRVIVAVSGGPDSVALVHVLWGLRDRLGIDLTVAHLNHRLRGPDSDGDAAFVTRLAAQLDLPVAIQAEDVRALSRARRLSLETAAREARYAFLERVAVERGAQKIATGHTADDQAETILMRLIRGSGVGGASGIRPVRDGRVVRPLLMVTHQEVHAYLAAHHLSARVDVSNADLGYLRNRVRHVLLPCLQAEYNPEIVAALSRFGEVHRAEEELLERETDRVFQQAVTEQASDRIVIAVSPFIEGALALRRRVVRHIVTRLGGQPDVLTFEHIERTLGLAESGRPGQLLALPGGIRVERRREGMVFRRGVARPFEVPLTIPGTTVLPDGAGRVQTRVLDPKDVPVVQERSVAVFDEEAIQPSGVVRTRRPGDRFAPIGMAGTKTLKALFNEWAIPRLERDRIPLLVSGDRVLWVVGHRVSRWGQVSPQTKRAVMVEWEAAT
ncbi:MAG: tRNA lysidine(34) synthetase TilS [Candidatus Latescibacteria bacterium]|nr:tRNA lysidine(34) synthetase TilS [Candidatus Latescibacterota bacterium]